MGSQDLPGWGRVEPRTPRCQPGTATTAGDRARVPSPHCGQFSLSADGNEGAAPAAFFRGIVLFPSRAPTPHGWSTAAHICVEDGVLGNLMLGFTR